MTALVEKRTVFTPGDGYKPLTWKGARLASSGKGTALIGCRCGQTLSLSQHEIAPSGEVNPSVGHLPPAGCGFHEFITLSGWQGAE